MEEILQGTDEWKLLRLGHATASRITDVMSKGRGSAESAGVRNYRAQLVAERLTGTVEETYCNADMQRGIDLEDTARTLYSFESGNKVDQIAFMKHPGIDFSGMSPDGMVGDDGLIEIKVPRIATHIEYVLNDSVPAKYIKQLQWQMAVSGRKWNDFISYCPELPDHMQLFIIRADRDDALISEMEKAVITFLASVELMMADLEAACQK